MLNWLLSDDWLVLLTNRLMNGLIDYLCLIEVFLLKNFDLMSELMCIIVKLFMDSKY